MTLQASRHVCKRSPVRLQVRGGRPGGGGKGGGAKGGGRSLAAVMGVDGGGVGKEWGSRLTVAVELADFDRCQCLVLVLLVVLVPLGVCA